MAHNHRSICQRSIVAVEALARWTNVEHKVHFRLRIRALAEECGLIEALTAFTLLEAFRQAERWPGLRIAVTFSAVLFRTPGFVELVTNISDRPALTAADLNWKSPRASFLHDSSMSRTLLKNSPPGLLASA